MACVLVDVDGTLLSGASSERAFVLHLLRTGRLGPRQVMAALWYSLRWAPRYGRHVMKKNKAYLADLTTTQVETLAAEFVRQRLASRLRPAVLKRLEQHRAAGDVITVLSGTPAFLAAPLAALAKAAYWRACECRHEQGRYSAAPPLTHPFAAAKLSAARSLCAEHGSSLRDCVAYADSIHDLPLLLAVGRAVAVHPDNALRRVALSRGWEIMMEEHVPRWRVLADRG